MECNKLEIFDRLCICPMEMAIIISIYNIIVINNNIIINNNICQIHSCCLNTVQRCLKSLDKSYESSI